MAKFTVIGLEYVREQLQERSDRVEGTMRHMLNAGAKIVTEEMQTSMREYKLKDTGDMIASIKASKIKRDKDGGMSISIAPHGVDYHKVPNAAKAKVYENGLSNLPARPWKTLADERARPKVLERMQEIFNAEMNRGGGGEE